MRWMRDIAERLQSKGAVLVMTVIAAVVFATGVIGTIALDDGKSAFEAVSTSTSTTSTSIASENSTTTPPQRVRSLEGFEGTRLTVTNANGEKRDHCAALASTPQQQAEGMMRKDDFGGYDAMAFPFAADSSVAFYMANVRIPLTVAFFDAQGHFVSAAEMPVCTVQDSLCQRFTAAKPFRLALELPQGGLESLQIGPNSSATVGGPCSA